MKKHTRNNGTYVDFKEILRRVRSINPLENKMYSKLDDLTLGRLFSEVFKDSARFNTTAREWFYYDGVVWTMDVGGMVVEQYAKLLARCLGIYVMEKKEASQEEIKFYSSIGGRSRRVTMLTDARDFNFVRTEDFDKDLSLFNCKNCVVNLDTMERLEHNPDLLLSKVSNVIYEPMQRSSDFEKFLSEIMLNDLTKIEYLKTIFGYALTGENTQEECYMCYGSTTRNGKSTLLEVISYMFGDYARAISPETLAQKDKNSRSASGDIARLDGCRFLHMSEPPKRMKFDVALLKTLLGRDKITARNLYEREFEFIPIFKLFINTNFLPVVMDDTLFSSGRVKVVTFDKHFEPEEQNPKLKSQLKTRENISGIFNWCLSGLEQYQKNDGILKEPEAVKLATEDYRHKSDKIQNFIDDCLEEEKGLAVTIKEAYEVFSQWCSDNGFGVENKSNFIEEIKSKGIFKPSAVIDGKQEKRVIVGYTFTYEVLNEIAHQPWRK